MVLKQITFPRFTRNLKQEKHYMKFTLSIAYPMYCSSFMFQMYEINKELFFTKMNKQDKCPHI